MDKSTAHGFFSYKNQESLVEKVERLEQENAELKKKPTKEEYNWCAESAQKLTGENTKLQDEIIKLKKQLEEMDLEKLFIELKNKFKIGHLYIHAVLHKNDWYMQLLSEVNKEVKTITAGGFSQPEVIRAFREKLEELK